MAQEIVLPQWGMEMQDATIVRWLKQEGDHVQEGEPLVELETAKISTELESIASGVVAHILVPEGAIVPIRTVLPLSPPQGSRYRGLSAPRHLARWPLPRRPLPLGLPLRHNVLITWLLRSCQPHAVWPRSGGLTWPRSRGQALGVESYLKTCTKRSPPAALPHRQRPRSPCKSRRRRATWHGSMA